jgi:hypothetical protein
MLDVFVSNIYIHNGFSIQAVICLPQEHTSLLQSRVNYSRKRFISLVPAVHHLRGLSRHWNDERMRKSSHLWIPGMQVVPRHSVKWHSAEWLKINSLLVDKVKSRLLWEGLCPMVEPVNHYPKIRAGNTKGGKYHCTIDLLLDRFGISCMITDNFCFICKTD